MVGDEPCNYLGPYHVGEVLGIEWFGACQDIYPKLETDIARGITFHLKQNPELVRPIQVIYIALRNTVMSIY